MKYIRLYSLQVVQCIVFVLSFLVDWYVPLSLVLLATVVLSILDKLGKGVVLREMIALHTCFICIGMPILGYTLYTRTNNLATMWARFMPVSEDVYFSFALPAITAYSIALCWPLVRDKVADNGTVLMDTIEKVKEALKSPYMKHISLTLVAVGLAMFYISQFLPVSLQFVFLLIFFSSFAGLLYVYYLPAFKFRWLILLLFAAFIILISLRTGMFTIVAYMGITLFSFFFLGSKASLLRKAALFFLGGLLLLTIQNVKPQYRKSTWKQDYAGNQSELFLDLFSQQIKQGDFFSEKAFFPIYYRTNQGFNVALVMRRIPTMQPYDNGENLFLSFASAFVPRILWPDKPEAGGKFNMRHYAGLNIRGWSTNVGPLGEAYGSFGVAGGIIYMFLLGAFITWAYSRVFLISKRLPLVLCWLPVLFYQITYSGETDSLQIMNSLVKSAFFIWLLYKLLPKWFGKKDELIPSK